MKVLVVDDSEVILRLTAAVLARAGYQVETTSEVADLPQTVRRFAPDAILLDLTMPAADGEAVAASLREALPGSDYKIIFHSSADEVRLARSVRQTGAAGFLPKGLAPPEMLGRLRRLLGS